MQISFKGKEKFLIGILCVGLVILIGFLISSYSTQLRYKKFYKTQMQKLKDDNQKDIAEKEKHIKYLINQNNLRDIDIANANNKIDSLEKVKNKIQIKYILKYKEIQKFNSEQIKNYWKNEFKN